MKTAAPVQTCTRMYTNVAFCTGNGKMKTQPQYIRPLAVTPLLDIMSGGDPLGLFFLLGGKSCLPA